jgi:hypothetical protein
MGIKQTVVLFSFSASLNNFSVYDQTDIFSSKQSLANKNLLQKMFVKQSQVWFPFSFPTNIYRNMFYLWSKKRSIENFDPVATFGGIDRRREIPKWLYKKYYRVYYN